MCLLCHALAGPQDWTRAPGGADARTAAHHRRRRVLRTVLGCYGLALREGGPGAPAVLADRKGSARVVGTLPELWPAAAQLAGRPLDPLDPELLARLAAAGDG